jgi:hypothetical protein
MQKDWIPQAMPQAVAIPRVAVTQQVWCPLSVSPAGAVLFGGLSSWPSSLVPRCWLSQAGNPYNRKLPSEREWLPRPAPATGTRWTNGSGLPTRCATATGRQMPKHAAVPIVIQSFCITPILAFFNSFWGLSRHLSRLDNPQKLLHDNEGSG